MSRVFSISRNHPYTTYYCPLAERKFTRPVGAAPAGAPPVGGHPVPVAMAAPPACRGRPSERLAARRCGGAAHLGWCWTGVSGWGRVAPQGCPGGTASGRATWEGWGARATARRHRPSQRASGRRRGCSLRHARPTLLPSAAAPAQRRRSPSCEECDRDTSMTRMRRPSRPSRFMPPPDNSSRCAYGAGGCSHEGPQAVLF